MRIFTLTVAIDADSSITLPELRQAIVRSLSGMTIIDHPVHGAILDQVRDVTFVGHE